MQLFSYNNLIPIGFSGQNQALYYGYKDLQILYRQVFVGFLFLG